MVITSNYGDVTCIKMGRDLDGQVLYWVAAYLVDDLLIDSGCRHTAHELLAWLEGRPVQQIYITHYHEDHIGGCALLQEMIDLHVLASPCTIKSAGNAPALFPYQELVWGQPGPVDYRPLNGYELKTANYHFKIIDTPGHSPDHTVLIEPNQGWCFSGDLFVSEKIKVLRPEEDIEAIIRSLEKLSEIELAEPGQELILFTASGKVFLNGREKIKNCLAYLNDLKTKVSNLYYSEGLNPDEIVTQLFGGESSLANLTDGQFSSVNLVKSLLKSSDQKA